MFAAIFRGDDDAPDAVFIEHLLELVCPAQHGEAGEARAGVVRHRDRVREEPDEVDAQVGARAEGVGDLATQVARTEDDDALVEARERGNPAEHRASEVEHREVEGERRRDDDVEFGRQVRQQVERERGTEDERHPRPDLMQRRSLAGERFGRVATAVEQGDEGAEPAGRHRTGVSAHVRAYREERKRYTESDGEAGQIESDDDENASQVGVREVVLHRPLRLLRRRTVSPFQTSDIDPHGTQSEKYFVRFGEPGCARIARRVQVQRDRRLGGRVTDRSQGRFRSGRSAGIVESASRIHAWRQLH